MNSLGGGGHFSWRKLSNKLTHSSVQIDNLVVSGETELNGNVTTNGNVKMGAGQFVVDGSILANGNASFARLTVGPLTTDDITIPDITAVQGGEWTLTKANAPIGNDSLDYTLKIVPAAAGSLTGSDTLLSGASNVKIDTKGKSFSNPQIEVHNLGTTFTGNLTTTGNMIVPLGFILHISTGGATNAGASLQLSNHTQINAPHPNGSVKLKVAGVSTLQAYGGGNTDGQRVDVTGALTATGDCTLASDAGKDVTMLQNGRLTIRVSGTDSILGVTSAIDQNADNYALKIQNGATFLNSRVTATGGTVGIRFANSNAILCQRNTAGATTTTVTGALTATGNCKFLAAGTGGSPRLSFRSGTGQAIHMGHSNELDSNMSNYALYVLPATTYINARVAANGGSVGLRLGNQDALKCHQPSGGTITTTVTGALTNTTDAVLATQGEGVVFTNNHAHTHAGCMLLAKKTYDDSSAASTVGYALKLQTIAGNSQYLNPILNGRYNISFRVTNVERALLTASGVNVIGVVQSNGTTLSSDDRLKWNERPIQNGLETIRKLSPQIYDKAITIPDDGLQPDETSCEAGLIAQEVLAIPEGVHCRSNSFEECLWVPFNPCMRVTDK